MSPGCYINTECPGQSASFPAWTRDTYGEAHLNSANDEDTCLVQRKADHDTWCGTIDTQMRFVRSPGCYFKTQCSGQQSHSFPDWTRDTGGETNQNAANNEAICLEKRKADITTWCSATGGFDTTRFRSSPSDTLWSQMWRRCLFPH